MINSKERTNVGIVTSIDSFHNNYGAALQCYALCEQIKRLGFSPLIINYQSQKPAANKCKKSVLKYIFSKDNSFFVKILYRLSRKKRQHLENLFNDFVNKEFVFFPKTKTEFDKLCSIDFPCKIFIAGSDQIWNPLNHDNQNDKSCFLMFSKKGDTKIAYAPSFGISDFPEKCFHSLKDYLKTFSYVSVREQSGADIITKCDDSIRKKVVLDPTLLLDSETYNKLGEESNLKDLPKNFILVYRFGKLKYFQKKLKTISKHLKMPIVELPCSIVSYGKRTKLYFDCGPDLFSKIISKASLVITDSFHCTVFSIINKKPFLTFLRQGLDDKKSMDSRMVDFLSEINLKERLICPNDFINLDKSFLLNVNYQKTDEIINKKRNESLDFLKSALYGSKKEN